MPSEHVTLFRDEVQHMQCIYCVHWDRALEGELGVRKKPEGTRSERRKMEVEIQEEGRKSRKKERRKPKERKERKKDKRKEEKVRKKKDGRKK